MTTLDQVIAEKLGNWYIGEWPIGNFILCSIALVLAVILCGAVGLERERRGRSAGLRTHLLVGIGSCILMIVSIYGFPVKTASGDFVNRDYARLAAQVVTGVGFLGAGAIIHKKDGIRGLTTAATIWIVMAIGLACGSMNFILAIGGTIIILVSLTVFKSFEKRLTKNAPVLVLHSELGKPTISRILEVAKESNCIVKEVHSEIADEGILELTFRATSDSEFFSTEDFINKLGLIDGVIDVDLLNVHK